jgi:hypothetical protein
VLEWFGRFSPLGWNIYVLDTVPDSQLNISRYIDIASPSVVPQALIDGRLDGAQVSQHMSDLFRYPLLLKYGGVYLDVGISELGDLDGLWEKHISNPKSQYDFAGFTTGSPADGISIVNFAMVSVPDSPLVLRAHKILLKFWEDKNNSTTKMRTMESAQRWFDESNSLDALKYVREKCLLSSMIEMGHGNGQPQPNLSASRQSNLEESQDHSSWRLKFSDGLSAKLFGPPTLGILWRASPESNGTEGAYAGWLPWAHLYQDQVEAGRP